MARYIGPVCRLCRREAMKLFLKGERCYTEKCAIEKRNFPPGQHGKTRKAKLAGYGLTPASLAAALHAQNIVVPSGTITTDAENVILRVSGAFMSEKDILAINFAVGDRLLRLADIAEVRREDKDPPDPIFRINGKPGLGLSISMRDGGDGSSVCNRCSTMALLSPSKGSCLVSNS